MRRYSVTEGPRAILMYELAEHIRGAEHLQPDEPDRAEAYRRALTELEMGAPTAMARHTEFRINEDLSRRYGVTEGTQAEILAELDRYGTDRAAQGKEARAARYAQAIGVIEEGIDDEVEVDRIRYRVVED